MWSVRVGVAARRDRALLRRRARPRRRSNPTTTWRPPTTSTSCSRTVACARSSPCHWGLVPFWAKDPGDRQPDDQRPRRDGRHEERLPARVREAAAASSRPTASTSGRPSRARRPSSRTSSTAPTVSRWPSPACGRCGATPTRPGRRGAQLHASSPASPTTRCAEIHDRMPVMLPPDAWDTWLDPEQPRHRPARQAARAGAGVAHRPAPGEHRGEQRPQQGRAPRRRRSISRRRRPATGQGRAELTATLRRRVDNLVLRWQARLDSEWADRVAAVARRRPRCSCCSLRSRWRGPARSRARHDLATYTQAAWLIRQGSRPIVTVNDAPAPARPAGRVRVLSDAWRHLRRCRSSRACSCCSRPRWRWPWCRCGGSPAGWPTCGSARWRTLAFVYARLSGDAQPQPGRLPPRGRRRAGAAVRRLLRGRRAAGGWFTRLRA